MPFVFAAPTTSTRHENPADMLIRTFRTGRIAMIMGVTLPKFSDIVIDAPNCPDTINLPAVTATIGGFECIPHVINQEFSWEMEFPPDPPWLSQQANHVEIANLCNLLDKSPAKVLSRDTDFSQVTRIQVRPQPNWPAVREHTYSHEMQHVCDAKWAVQKIFGPVVQMIDDYARANVRVHCADRDVLSFFAGGGNEATTIEKYLNATHTMGSHYHATNGGGPPVLTFVGLSPNGLYAYIDLSHAYGTFPVSFYTGRPHAYFRVTTLGVRDELEGFDPPARPTPVFTQEAVDTMAGGGGNDDASDDGSAHSSDEYEW